MIKSEIVFENGFTKLKINGRTMPFAAYRSFHPQKKYVNDFYKHGFEIFNVFPSGIMTALADRTIPYSQFGAVWTGENEYNWDNLKKQTNLFNKECPKGFAALMIHLDTPQWFLEKYPDSGDTWETFIQGAMYEKWRTAAVEYMTALMDKADELMPERIYGYFLMCGGTTEWYTRELKKALENPTKSHLEAYRRFKGDERAVIPNIEEFSSVQNGIFTTDENVLAYRRFLNTATADTLNFFADKAKEHCRDERVVCSFFCYTASDCANTVRYSYNESQKIYADKNINAITTPASYNFRKLNSTSAFRAPVDSLILHNKLFIHEIDSKTHLTHKNKLANTHMSGIDDTFNTIEETTAYLRREIGMTLAKGQGYWLFDMFGGWFDSAEMMSEIENLHSLSETLAKTNSHSMSETALMIDLESNYYIGEDADYPMNELQIREMNLCGFPWDMYITDDLCCKDFDFDRYKLYIFPNLFFAKPEISAKIKFLRQKGKSILFLHAPGCLSGNTEEVTNIKLRKYPHTDTAITAENSGKIFDYSREVNAWRQMRGEVREKNYLNPVFFADEPCEVVARYADNSIAAAVKKRGDGFDAYSALAPLDAELIKEFAKRANVFSYADNAVVYLNSAMLTVYSADGGNVRVRWPFEVTAEDYFTKEKFTLNTDGTDISFNEKETRIFLITRFYG